MSVVHTVTRTITAGGTLEYPREIRPLLAHLGTTVEAWDGTPTNIWRGAGKQRWEIVYESPRPEVVERWRARWLARAAFAFVDPYAESYNAIIPAASPPDWSIIYPAASGTVAGTAYRGFRVEVWRV